MKKRLFHILTGRNSGSIAKKRLEFLLIADRAGCTPEISKNWSRFFAMVPEFLFVRISNRFTIP